MTATETNPPYSVAPERRSPHGASLGWFKTEAYPELEGMGFVPSVQVALRSRLRLSYWLGGCKTITPDTVDKACRHISMADATGGQLPQPLGSHHVDAVLTSDRGFEKVVDPETGELVGWAIPDLYAQAQQANASFDAGRTARSARGKLAARARWDGKASADSGAAPETTATTGSHNADF